MHGFIGGGAFPRNHTPRNPSKIDIPTLRLDDHSSGPSEPPNPKWLDAWHAGREPIPGAINFSSLPQYEAGDVPVLDRIGGHAKSTWGGKVAAHVNPTVTGEIGIDKSRAALVRAAETARTLAAAKRAWGDLRTHGKMYNKPSPPDIWTKRDNEHRRLYRDKEHWGPNPQIVPEPTLARRYGSRQFAQLRKHAGFPAPIPGTRTWRRHDVLAFERRARDPVVAVQPRGRCSTYIAPNAEHGGNSLAGLLSYTQYNMVSEAARLRSRGVTDPIERKLTRGEWDHFAILAKSGDRRAHDILCEAALPVAKSAARRYSANAKIDVGDLTSDALVWFSEKSEQLLGDMRSVLDGWNPEKGRGFLAFLRQSIVWRIKNMNRGVAAMPVELSLDAAVGDTDKTIADYIADDTGADDDFDHDTAHTELDQVVCNHLDERERYVIMRRHRLNGKDDVPTQEELGVELGISRTMVGKIEDRAISKIEEITGRKIVL